MAVYFVTGKLGSGKTLSTVGIMRDYLEQGRRVATNLDLYLEHMLPATDKSAVIRLPDKPRLQDMELLGLGCEDENEERYGCIVLDELATWFNTRNWRDPARLQLIDWFLHSRKKHWDIYFIVQDIDSIDGQLINALCEHLVVCGRLDRLNIPYIGWLLRLIGFNKVMPKLHYANVYYGQSKNAIRVNRWWYRGRDLYRAYRTGQIFEEGIEIIEGKDVDMRRSYTLLPAFYVTHQSLINHYQDEIAQLRGALSDKNRPATAGGFLSRLPPRTLKPLLTGSLALLVSACVMYNRAGREQEPPQVQASATAQPVTENKPATAPLSVPPPPPPKPIEADAFQMLTEGKILVFESLVNDAYGLRGKIRIHKDGGFTSTSLDDARQLGYVIEDRITHVRITNGRYTLNIKKR